MADEWPSLKLGELMELAVSKVQVHPGREYPIVGVLNRGRGLLRRDPIMGSETKYRELHRVDRGLVLYSKLKAFEGAVTVALDRDLPAFASPEFPTFRCGTGLSPEYFALVTQLPAFWSELSLRSSGMGGRRERVSPRQFLDIALPTPPLEVQRRIVDLIGAIDVQLVKLETEANALSGMSQGLRDTLLTPGEGWVRQPLGALTTKIGSGATPRGGEGAYKAEGISLIRSQNVLEGVFGWEGLARIDEEQAAVLDNVIVQSGDALINITGASVSRTCVVEDAALPARVNQHVAILRADPDRTSGSFISQSLRRSDVREHLDRLAAAGSTRQALTKAQLEAVHIDVPETVIEQENIVATLAAVGSDLDNLRNERRRLADLRAQLLNAVLSREVEVPEAYDLLLNAGVA